ncbi:hypothetical protein MJH12_17480 [bacterium]|nr:hypothetical protein [bacterium]
MMSLVFLSCVFIFLLFFSFLSQVVIIRMSLKEKTDDPSQTQTLAKKLAFNIQVLLLFAGSLIFYGKIAFVVQISLFFVIPMIWFRSSKKIHWWKASILQFACQYSFLICYLIIYHFTVFAVDSGVFRPLPANVSLPVISVLDDKIKEVFVAF